MDKLLAEHNNLGWDILNYLDRERSGVPATRLIEEINRTDQEREVGKLLKRLVKQGAIRFAGGNYSPNSKTFEILERED